MPDAAQPAWQAAGFRRACIAIDPLVRGGLPCLAGTRLWPALIAGYVRTVAGADPEEAEHERGIAAAMKDYRITREEVLLCEWFVENYKRDPMRHVRENR